MESWCSSICAICEENQSSNSSSLSMSMQNMIRLSARTVHQQRGDIIVRLQSTNPLLQRWIQCRVQWFKNIGTGRQRCGKKWYGQMSRPSSYSWKVGECLCGVYQENGTGLNAWPLTVRGSGRVYAVGSTCHHRGREGSLKINTIYGLIQKWCDSYSMAFADTRYQPISTHMGDFGPTYSLSTIIIKKRGNIFWKNAAPSLQFTSRDL